MADVLHGVVTEVRGSAVRCSGGVGEPHEDVIVPLPVGEIAVCPRCGRVYRRSERWNQLSGATWPRQD